MSGFEALLTGRTLVNRYRIGEVIGRGGFAAVYRADDDRLGRPVAVKVITYPAPDAEAREHLRERFQREARAAASMPQHPNLVTVHDFGTDPELGLDFLVMELLHGENLATYLDRNGPPPLPMGLRILREATEGLWIGHRAGLVHRDVKAGNIFLARTGEQEPVRVCLLDFGIAHLAEESADTTRLTKAGFTPHSPAYASPEQLRGEPHLTAASDVFSLGIVGYQLLTGEKPFGNERRRSAEWTEPRSARELDPAIPEAVDGVLRTALAREPGERFQDAGEMGAALDAATGGAEAGTLTPILLPGSPSPAGDETLPQPEPQPQPVAAAPSTPMRRTTDRRRRVPAWATAAVIVLLLGAAGVWAMSRGGESGREARGPELGPGVDSAAAAEPVSGADLGAGESGGSLPLGATATEGSGNPAANAGGEGAVREPGVATPGEMGAGQVYGPDNERFPPGLGAGGLPPGQAKSAPATAGAPPAVAPRGADTLSSVPYSGTQPTTVKPDSTPTETTVPVDSIIPRPPPRLLGRPAHPAGADSI